MLTVYNVSKGSKQIDSQTPEEGLDKRQNTSELQLKSDWLTYSVHQLLVNKKCRKYNARCTQRQNIQQASTIRGVGFSFKNFGSLKLLTGLLLCLPPDERHYTDRIESGPYLSCPCLQEIF